MASINLGEIADIITGPFGSMLHKSDYRETGIPVIMPQDIGDRTLSLDNIARIGQQDAGRLARYATVANDIVYARRGDVEKHAFITADEAGALCGTGCLRVRVDERKADPLFVSFYLNRPESRMWIRLHAVGSNMPNINTDILSELPMELPDLESQRKVGNLLRRIDVKIANNKKLMAGLEETARLIYDYWFTQFDFPDENGRPYRSSGGKMVWSDELKREIPADWKAGMLSAVCRYADETIAANALDAQTYISLDNMMPNYGGITASEYCPSEGSCKSYRIGDTLLGNIRPYYKKVFQASRDGGCSPDVLVIRPTNGGRCYVYDTIARDCFIDYVVAGAKGTKMPRGDKDHIMRFRMAIPPRGIIEQYEKLVIQIHEYRSHAAAEDFELRSLRDWLLPMLMNGQLSIE